MRVGGREFNSYKTMLFLGSVAGVYAGAATGVERGLDAARFSLVAVVLLIPAFVGARLWFVARHRDRYRNQWRLVAQRSEGGWALFGGLVTAVVVSVPFLRLCGLRFWVFWDAASVTMLVGLILTRFGCLMNGCCAGRPTLGPLGMWLPNWAGEWQRRYPTQLLEIAWSATLLTGALAVRNAVPFDGALFASVVALYCAARLLLEATREDSHAPRFLKFTRHVPGSHTKASEINNVTSVCGREVDLHGVDLL
jgi:phosphatidylglycerol---prolipoprotein diacylglyceryl transferase